MLTHKEWVDELRAQIEESDPKTPVTFILETDGGSGTLTITDVQYDATEDKIVVKFA